MEGRSSPTSFQTEVATLFFALPEADGSLLAGGAARLALGLNHRLTDDLDLFTTHDMTAAALIAESRLPHARMSRSLARERRPIGFRLSYPVLMLEQVTRDEAVALVAAHGWTVARVTKRGYLVMRCSCGNHQETLHKTPSDPNHFKRKARHMVTTCSRPVP